MRQKSDSYPTTNPALFKDTTETHHSDLHSSLKVRKHEHY